jgi:hypothetical protein
MHAISKEGAYERALKIEYGRPLKIVSVFDEGCVQKLKNATFERDSDSNFRSAVEWRLNFKTLKMFRYSPSGRCVCFELLLADKLN